MIDVLMPFHGDPRLLRLAVQSVREQTCASWRLVVVDDAYPDESVAAWFANLDDPRVEYHRHPSNVGVNANFRHCLAQATAPHFVLMGCDDLMRPTYVANVLAAAESSEAAMIQPGVMVIDERGEPTVGMVDRLKERLKPVVDGTLTVGGEALAVSVLHGNWTYFPAFAWRTDVVQRIGFRPELDTALDLALIIDLLVAGHQMLLLEHVDFCYRRHDRSASSVAADDRRFAEERHYFTAVSRELAAAGWPRAARAARVHWTSRLHALTRVPGAVRAGDVRRAGRLVAHATS